VRLQRWGEGRAPPLNPNAANWIPLRHPAEHVPWRGSAKRVIMSRQNAGAATSCRSAAAYGIKPLLSTGWGGARKLGVFCQEIGILISD